MESLDLNRLVKEVDLLTKTEEILEGKDDNVSSLCYKIKRQVEQLRGEIDILRTLIDKQKNQIEECKDILSTLSHVANLTTHMEENIPEKYLYSTTNSSDLVEVPEKQRQYISPSPDTWGLISPAYSSQSSTKCGAQNPRPYLKYVECEEFDNVPKYMKGRLNQEALNNFIDGVNMALQKKYKLFSRPRNSLRGKLLNEYDAFKKQETKETIEKGVYFCVAEDLKILGSLKMDKSSQNMLNILRNIRRLREIRTPGVIRYAVV